MNQLSLSLPETRARRSDPSTSKAAATASVEFSAGHKGRILAALKQHGPRSAHELSLLIGLTVVQIDRRLPDLASAGLARVQKTDDGLDVVKHGCRVWTSEFYSAPAEANRTSNLRYQGDSGEFVGQDAVGGESMA